jgi:hypothetical protein
MGRSAPGQNQPAPAPRLGFVRKGPKEPMRFLTWIPLFILLQFSLCGQEDPVIPEPGYLGVAVVDGAGVPVPDVRVKLNGVTQLANPPAVYEVVAELAQTVSVSATGWGFTPSDTTVTLAEAEELSLTFIAHSVLTAELTVRALDGEDAPIGGVTVSLNGEAQAGEAPLALTLNPDTPYSLSVAAEGWNFTPADSTIMLEGGGEAELIFRGEQPSMHLVLLEDFSNTSCVPCPEADEAMWEAVGQASGMALPIAFHPRFPNPSDPFYLYSFFQNPPWSLNTVRTEVFYEISALPNVRVDGLPVSTPSSSATILADIETRLAVEPSLEMVVTREHDGAEVTVAVEGQVLREVPDGDWRLYMILIETLVHYDGASNGQTEFRNTVRHLNGESNGSGQPQGEAVDLGLGSAFQSSVVFTPNYGESPGGVVESNLRAVAFVQNTTTFEILDAVIDATGGP